MFRIVNKSRMDIVELESGLWILYVPFYEALAGLEFPLDTISRGYHDYEIEIKMCNSSSA